jgi:hypothetical protein
MSSKSETGHAKNVANFYSLISFVVGYGTDYNPSKPTLPPAVLSAKHTEADNAVKAVNTAVQPHTAAVNARQASFKPINKLATRIINALDVAVDDDAIVKDARTIVNKLMGNRKTPKPVDPITGTEKAYSASQRSFDMRVDHFHKLVQLVKATPDYGPNETELQVATLEALHASLEASNNAVKDAYTDITNARDHRDTVLYKAPTGLVDVAADVKKYVKSAFGADSQRFKQVSGLQFKRLLKRKSKKK